MDLATAKRKREALGEVARPAANVRRDVHKESTAGTDLKGKAKAKEVFDGVMLKKPASSVKPPSTTRQSLRSASVKPPSSASTTVRRGRSAAAQEQVKPAKPQLEELKEEEEEYVEERVRRDVRDEHPMAIDAATHLAPIPAPRRLNVARSAAAVSTTRIQIQKRVYQAGKVVVEEQEEEEDIRVYKKRRTSSEAPEDAAQEQPEVEEEEFAEADPNGDQWVDLDADDHDDPLMVSEYVADIFEYLKEVEVRVHYFPYVAAIDFARSSQLCRIRNTWRCRRTLLGRCEAFSLTG